MCHLLPRRLAGSYDHIFCVLQRGAGSEIETESWSGRIGENDPGSGVVPVAQAAELLLESA